MRLQVGVAVILCLLSGCATEINPATMSRIENSEDVINVSRFRCCGEDEAPMFGLQEGIYRLEYETKAGKFYRGPGLAVKIPATLNFNKEKYPEPLFDGGVYIANDPNVSQYQIYYYQNNLPGAAGPTVTVEQQLMMQENIQRSTPGADPTATAAGTALGAGLVDGIIASSRGNIVLIPPNKDWDVRGHVSRP